MKEVKLNTDKLIIIQLSGFTPDIEEQFVHAFQDTKEHKSIMTNVPFKSEIITKGKFIEIVKLSPEKKK